MFLCEFKTVASTLITDHGCYAQCFVQVTRFFCSPMAPSRNIDFSVLPHYSDTTVQFYVKSFKSNRRPSFQPTNFFRSTPRLSRLGMLLPRHVRQWISVKSPVFKRHNLQSSNRQSTSHHSEQVLRDDCCGSANVIFLISAIHSASTITNELPN